MDISNIGTLYRNLKPRLEILEDQRKVVFKKIEKLKKTCLIVGITLGVISFFQGIWWAAFMVAIAGLVIYAILYNKYKKSYRENYKAKIFTELVDELGFGYSYDAKGSIEESELIKSGLFHQFTKMQSEDLITGKFDTYSFKLVETNLELHKKSKGEEKKSYTIPVFKGLFFAGTIPLTFPSRVWIFSKNAPVVYTKSRILPEWKKVNIGHDVFTAEYEAYSEDAEMASQLLYPSILDTILETSRTLIDDKMSMELSFQDNSVYISISSVKDLFEPPLSIPVTDFDTFKTNFEYLAGTTGLLQKLTLVKANA